jgi:ADP-heptose:LPS heptosyltransferase
MKVLIIRPGGIGDAVLLLPVLRELKRGGHTLDILCEKRNVAVFRSQPGLCGQIFCYDVLGELTAVGRNSYDWVVDTEQWHCLSAVLSRLIRSRRTIGFGTRPERAGLFYTAVEYSHEAYELHNFSRLFSLLGLRGRLHLEGSYAVSAPDIAWAKASLSRPYAALALGGSSAARRFSSEQLVLMGRLIIDSGLNVVLLGGGDMKVFAGKLLDEMKSPGVVSFVGKTSLAQSVALVAGARCFIGQDSGLLHIAAALSVPSVAVFGPGNRNKWAPENTRTFFVDSGLLCSPCTFFGYAVPQCHGTYPCLRSPELTVRLLQAVKEILSYVQNVPAGAKKGDE